MLVCGEMALKIGFSEQRQKAGKDRILASRGECRLATYLREILIPTLKKGDIVVMDNLRSHHVKEVEELLRQNEITLLYLPPYSPDLNPIEKMWSKMKSCLRR